MCWCWQRVSSSGWWAGRWPSTFRCRGGSCSAPICSPSTSPSVNAVPNSPSSATTPGTHREVLGHYTLGLVDQAISVVLGATVLAYTLYTVAPDTVAKVGSEGLMATVPIVLYGLFRYLYLLHSSELGGSPTRVLATDRPLLITVIVWVGVAAVVIGLAP